MRDVVKTDMNKMNNIKRNRRRQRNNSIYYLLVLLLVVGMGVALSTTILFNISEIAIVGQSQYTPEEIKLSTGLSNGDNLVRTNVDKIQKNVMSNLMYVDEVRIKKDYPNRIIVEVTPSVPTAQIETKEMYLLISKNGKILEKFEEPERNIPVIKGYVPATDIVTQFIYSENETKDKIIKLICEQISEQELYSIEEFDMSDIYALSAYYDDRISIRLGNSEELDYKLRYAMQILNEQLPTNKEGYLIFRSNNQYQYVSKEDMEKHIQEIAESSGIVLESQESSAEETGREVTGEVSE